MMVNLLLAAFGGRVAFGRIVAAEVLLRIRPPDPRMRDDAIAAKPAKVLDRTPAVGGVTVEKRLPGQR